MHNIRNKYGSTLVIHFIHNRSKSMTMFYAKAESRIQNAGWMKKTVSPTRNRRGLVRKRHHMVA